MNKILAISNLNSIGLRDGPGGVIGAIITVLMFLVAFFSSSSNYSQLALGLTYVTLPALFSLFFLLLHLHWIVRFARLKFSDYCVLVIYVFCLASWLWTKVDTSWPLQIYWYSICFIVYFSVRIYVTTPVRIQLLGFGVILGVLVAGVLMTTQTDEWGNIIERQSIGDLNSNFSAYVLAGSLYLYLVINYLGLFPHWFRFINIPLVGLIFVNINALQTRGALFGCVAICFWTLIHTKISIQFIRIVVLILFVLVFIITLGFSDPILVLMDLSSARSTGDLAGRLPVWEIARDFIYNNFVLGVGIGSFASLNPIGTGAHNVFLTILLEIGIFGFVCFLLFLVSVFNPALTRGSSLEIKYIFGAFFFFWLPIASSGHWELAPFSWLLLGLTFNLLRLRRVNHA